MLEFFNFFVDMWRSLIGVLDNAFVSLGYGVVSIWGILVSFIVLGFIISMFWRGAKY